MLPYFVGHIKRSYSLFFYFLFISSPISLSGPPLTFICPLQLAKLPQLKRLWMDTCTHSVYVYLLTYVYVLIYLLSACVYFILNFAMFA